MTDFFPFLVINTTSERTLTNSSSDSHTPDATQEDNNSLLELVAVRHDQEALKELVRIDSTADCPTKYC